MLIPSLQLGLSNWQSEIHDVIDATARIGFEFLIALMIVLVGVWTSNRIVVFLQRALGKMHTDATFASVVCNFAKWAVRGIAFIFALGQMGVATASVLTMVGTAGLAIGLALQGTLQNIAAGLMLLLWRPFGVGDSIEGIGAVSGTVQDVTLFTTHLIKNDGTMMFVPNSQLWSNPVTNLSARPYRMISIQLLIARHDDIEDALGVLRQIINADPRILQQPDAMSGAVVSDYTDLGTKLNLMAWTKVADFYPTKADLLRTIKPQLEVAGCTLPCIPFTTDSPAMFGQRLDGDPIGMPMQPRHV
ncbi:mechanosensitive ion channel domain-containing protein [Dyella sp. M7H15-1]|uniref:mechanosensitive ion channel family protein n=1 Tax=Dyella sp. M7H15-1 TaxID=2501295 RepID=UPI0013E89A50|nr:mechanosensitive ion channel domain-containing protein [Dyella sp. M7H15-1]